VEVDMTGTKRVNHRRRRAGALAVLGMLALLAAGMRAHAADEAAGRIERIELKADGSSTKVIVMLSRPLAFDVQVLDGDAARKSARRLVLDFANTTLAPEATKPIEVANDLLRQIRPGQFNARTARIVLDLASGATHSVDAFESPPHVTIALAGTATGGTPSTAGTAAAGTPSTGAAEASKATARTIPIKARGRRPYSLNYSR
jgi:N-acetylmuramoyl-L-alanine amidase